mmetsp:Transcript_2269/g.3843  ORF Transcript_2269/g.3843 Transcript_2269/m.3843 type:complete len:336 (+) Transcript_2269:127-1134(+)
MTCVEAMNHPQNALSVSSPETGNSSCLDLKPSESGSLGMGMGLKRSTGTKISSSLKMSIAKELFTSKTTQSTSSSNKSMRSRKSESSFRKSLSTKNEDDGSSHFGTVPKANLGAPCSSHKSTSQLPSTLRRSLKTSPRPCLKTGDRRSISPKPPTRTMSACQLQVRLPGQKKPVTRVRSITFNESVKVRRIPSKEELLATNKTNELWFQAEEYDQIKRKTFNLIRAIQHGETGGVNYCTRGLEKYFNAHEVQGRRTAAWDSVLDEQEGQRRLGSFSDLRLSKASLQYSKSAMAEAAERGKLDEDAIERYVKRTRQILRTQSMPTASMAQQTSRHR